MTRLAQREIVAFRLARQHLAEPAPADAMVSTASAAAMRNSPPGSAAVSLHARVADLAPDAVAQALADKSLVELWCLRASPCLVAPDDLPVFTAGLLPDDESSLRHFLQGFGRTDVDMRLAVERATAAVCEALDGRVLSKSDLSSAVTKLLPDPLTPYCTPCKVAHVNESLLRSVGLRGVLAFAPREGVGASFVRLDQWAGYSPEGVDVDAARAELVRRYLRWYGPSTPRHFATWAGISLPQGKRWWALVEGELAEVDAEGIPKASLLEADLAAVQGVPAAKGVRLLPPADPYLLVPDRDTIVADADWQKALWRPIGSPGAVLADGDIVALWRPQKKGARLVVSVEPFGPVDRSRIEEAVEALAPHRGCMTAEVTFA
ncbi:MAG TPA: winged helix DNA-binding domain-containing protein [Mycobacteriales bacterium]|nr:winged helix DNA-binding domain-containing protein [Mycobacteriales bacterium]